MIAYIPGKTSRFIPLDNQLLATIGFILMTVSACLWVAAIVKKCCREKISLQGPLIYMKNKSPTREIDPWQFRITMGAWMIASFLLSCIDWRLMLAWWFAGIARRGCDKIASGYPTRPVE